MSRDPGLEELVRGDLPRAGLVEKAMFGGWAWLLEGHLVCGASEKGLLARIGRERAALEIEGVSAAIMGGRRMKDWVRANENVYGDDRARRRLIDAAVAFVRKLPPK